MTPVTYKPTPRARLQALRAIGANGDSYHFTAYDAIWDGVNRVLYIAQDDWLPEPFSGEADPIEDEWKDVLAVADRLGTSDASWPEPAYDHETGIWVWVVPFNLN